MDPISFFVATSALGGVIGNSTNAAVWKLIPEFQKWYQGEGQPVNHHVQRALRAAYLSATERLLEEARGELDEEKLSWCYRALQWVSTQSGLLKNETYKPPLPPDGWEPAHVVEPSVKEAAEAVKALRESLAGMLAGEWAAAGLGLPPESVAQALTKGWARPNGKADWFDLISLYFNHELKKGTEAESAFQNPTLSKILAKLTYLVERFDGTPGRAFFAPSEQSYFVGRDAALEVLNVRLAEPGAVVPLIGMPGLGKTRLAVAFAHRHQDDFEGVYWINCAGQSLSASITDLARQLGIRPEGEPQSQLRDIRHRCAERHCLLVLDNVESEETCALIPGHGRCAVLITTRLSGLPFLAQYRAPELAVFSPEECLDLFRAHLTPADVDTRRDAYLQLSERLGRLPIAVAVAAGLLASDLRWSLVRLLAESKPYKLSHGKLDIGDLLDKAIASVGDSNDVARRLLSAMAVCAHSGFRLSLAAEIAGIEDEPALDGLQELRSRSLVDVVDREKLLCRLHSLIRGGAGQDAAFQQKHAEVIARRFESWEESWRECEEDWGDWRLALDWAGDGTAGPTERIELLLALADSGFRFAHRRGLMTDASRAMEAAAAAFEKLGDRAGLQVSYGNQAVILQGWGRLEDAMALLKKQEAICLELGDRSALQASYGNQALILKAWGQLEDAMALHKKEEAICLELGDRAALGASYGNQAGILGDWGRLGDAMALLKKEEAICLELGDRAGLQASYGNQALILQAWGRLEDAVDLHKRKEAICLELGDRAGLGCCYGNQAVILKAWGRLEDAMALHKKEEAICVELGDRAGLGRSYGNQALILKAWGRLEDAMALHKKEEAICLELGDRAGLQRSYGNQALILQAWGRLQDAMALLKKQETICLELGLRDSLRISLHNQAITLEAMGQADEASRLRAQAEAIQAEMMRGREASA
jgi:tetratricopeptide (TPR) repeat protein